MAEDGRDLVSLAVVVVNYNSHGLLRRHLAACDLDRVPALVVVVDNSDDPYHRAAAKAVCAHLGWTLIPAGGNIGFGAGINLGVARAMEMGASEFIILNPDAWIDVDTARRLEAAVTKRPMQAVSPVVRRPDGRAWFSRGAILMQQGRVRSHDHGDANGVPWLTGAALAMSRQLWQQVGGFDERYFLYWEDVDLSWRILQAGGQLEVIEDLSARHLVGATQAGAVKSPVFVYYNCRNRLFFAGLHVRGAQRRGWLLSTPRLTWELIGLGGRTPAAFRAGLRGVAAGLPYALGIRRDAAWPPGRSRR